MTKCLFKALKAVDLEKYIGLFRSLGYDSAGALAHFRAEHFEKLNFNEQEVLRLIALLDVLKDATREGKICPHYFHSTKTNTQQSTIKSVPIRASWSDETIQQQRNSSSNLRKQSNENIKPKRSMSSTGVIGRSSSTKTKKKRSLGPKSFLNRPPVQHIKVKSYNYGVPTNRRPRNKSQHSSIFVSSPRHSNDLTSYAKPAEIYVYARKRPLLSTETNFQDTIAVPDNKRIIITENKANLDCTPLLKKTEFQFDHVFGSDASNKEIFESTVLPFISTTHRHNLTYICFGQTGSGKSHTIFGSRNTDGLLVHCTQLLLQETISLENNLICSFYEIYNNQVYDLVNAGKRLFVREDGEHHVNVIGTTEVVLKNLENLHGVIDDGLSRRHHGKSAFNSNSSRSHAVFQIILKNNYDASESFRLIFIDLAGSERATDAQNNQRQTRREGAQINWSLLALKECIRSMDMTHSHAPFRQSKLTHILRDSLVGSKTRTCLMANVSPPDDCCQCSLNTLQYASRIRDISIRHRHRSTPMNYSDDYIKEQEKPQRNFKPATASTPVHRLISTVNQRIYKPTNVDTHLTKPIDIDWQLADDDDVPISGGGDNHPLKSLTSTTLEFMRNSNIQSNHHHSNRYQTKKTNDIDQSPSSYFPQPQPDIKKSSSNKQSYNNSRLLYDNGNERQYKIVPAPITNPSIQPSNTTRIIPIAPIQISEDNPYESGTGTESLGTKIIKVATDDNQRHEKSNIIESLNFNKKYDTDTKQMIYSDRQGKTKNQTDFLSNREELLSIVSSRLTPVKKRPSSSSSSSIITPKNSKMNSSYSNKSKNLFSSPNKTRQKTRLIRSTSSTTSLASVNPEKKSINPQKLNPTIRRSPNRHHQRTAPLRVHHSSDSEEHEKIRPNIHRKKPYPSTSTRSEACQTTNDIPPMKNEQEPTVRQSSSSPVLIPSMLVQTSFDQIKPTFNDLLQQPISPANINNPWPITTSFNSPSKDFGVRVSDQLTALRSLLENRLIKSIDENREKKEPSILQTSPGTFARQFLQSFRQSTYENNLTEFPSDIDDDDKEVERNFNTKIKQYDGEILSTSTTSSNHRHYERIIQPNLSSLSDELNQARVSSSATPISTSTITSNLAAKIDTQEPRVLSSQGDGIHSHPSTNENLLATNNNKGVSNPTSDSERTSQVNLTSQNPFTGTSSGGSSSNGSPILLPQSNTFDIRSSTTNGHDHLFDSGKGSSFLTGSSFDALLNSLKTMREKDLDFIVRTGDDKLIPVAD